MKYLNLTLLFLFSLSYSQLGQSQQSIQSQHFQVLYHNPALESYAQEVANYAEQAWQVVSELFRYEVTGITIRLEENTDIYNGYASVYPHKIITLRPLFPSSTLHDPATNNQLYHVILHELVHIVQLSYVLGPDTSEERQSAPALSLFNRSVASAPPAWFIEGIAVWVESTYTQSSGSKAGGRNNDLMMQNLVRALVTQGKAPSLADASLMTYERYPAGHTRYLLGGQFVGYLVEQYGFEAILKLLRQYNERGFLGNVFKDFSWAWHQANGTHLQDEWQAWLDTFTLDSVEGAEALVEDAGLSSSGFSSRSPVPSPDGRQLAWVDNAGNIMLADLQPETTATENLGEARAVLSPRVVLSQRAPNSLRWQDNQHLLYTRTVIQAHDRFSELLRLNVDTGRETQLSHGARVQHPAPLPNGCVLLNHDVLGKAAELWHWCSDERKRVWRLPTNAHVLDMASSPAGRVVMTLWQDGQFDIVAVEVIEGRLALHYLTRDAFVDAEPFWQDEQTLLFRSARSANGIDEGDNFQIYRLNAVNVSPLLRQREHAVESNPEIVLEQLTNTPFGASYPSSDGKQLFYAQLTGEGFRIVAEPLTTVEVLETRLGSSPNNKASSQQLQRYPQTGYNPLPSLAPYALAPTNLSIDPNNWLDFAAEASLYGQDVSTNHSYRLSVGYAHQRKGYLAGLYGYLLYGYQGNVGLSVANEEAPLQFKLLAGLYPYAVHYQATQENVLGAGITLSYSHPLDIQQQRWRLKSQVDVQVLRYAQPQAWDVGWDWGLRSSLALSNERKDTWGYASKGMYLRLDYVDTATSPNNSQNKRSKGLWLSGRANYALSTWGLAGTAFIEAQTGYRPLVGLPTTHKGNFLSQLNLGYRYSVPLAWRYGDGLYALERFTFAPQLYGWLGDGSAGAGAALLLAADTTMVYAAPISLQATVGYTLDMGVWTRFGLAVPLN